MMTEFPSLRIGGLKLISVQKGVFLLMHQEHKIGGFIVDDFLS
jgi:hypothetical protein